MTRAARLRQTSVVLTPHYFPVGAAPLKMAASLSRFGTDFGFGSHDQHFFQIDERAAEYAELKRAAPAERRFVVGDDPTAMAARREAYRWMVDTLTHEHPAVALGLDPSAEGNASDFEALAERVQEDFSVLQAGPDDRGRTLVVDVRFPSKWRPERLKEATFTAIHKPVPDFPGDDRSAIGLVRAMVDRGPYVRFVWTLTPTPELDLHPDRSQVHVSWDRAGEAFFRVERQVTVPLLETRSSVFLIRVYVMPVAQLSETEQSRLAEALRVMPDHLRRYKSLPDRQQIDRLFSTRP